jgi:hypothetical protein
VGVDWSPSTLGAAAITTENPDGLSSDYRGFTYDDRGLGTKLARLQTEGQMLHRKAARLEKLAATAAPEVRARLETKIAVLNEHRTAVGVKRAVARDPGRRARTGAPVPGQDQPDPEQAAAPPGPPQPAHHTTAVGGDSETVCSCTSSVSVGHGQTRTAAR